MTANLVGIGGVFARESGNNRDYFLINAHGDVTAVTNGSTVLKTLFYWATDASHTNALGVTNLTATAWAMSRVILRK